MRIMELDPMELLEAKEGKKDRLNTLVAVTIALLATFMGLCKVKDDNICQAMQQAQASSIDDWGYYQAKKIRIDVANGTMAELRVALLSISPEKKSAVQSEITKLKELVADEDKKKDVLYNQAKGDMVTYKALNTHDDQFDLSDAALAVSIALLAVTSLTQKKWLFWIAMFPTALGVFMGLSGLFGLGFHFQWVADLLGA